jgi:plastocyanin
MGRFLRLGLALAVIAAAALLLPRIVSTRESTTAPGARDLLIVARGMTYYVDGGDEPNPSLQFKPGEQIKLTFRNEDAGMEHDFAIPGWGLATKRLQGEGQDVVAFTVPGRAESGKYACTPHSEMMNGQVVVE